MHGLVFWRYGEVASDWLCTLSDLEQQVIVRQNNDYVLWSLLMQIKWEGWSMCSLKIDT